MPVQFFTAFFAVNRLADHRNRPMSLRTLNCKKWSKADVEWQKVEC